MEKEKEKETGGEAENENENEKEILSKISSIKEILNSKINSFEDFKSNKESLVLYIDQIESFLNKIFNKKEEPKENEEEIKKEENDDNNNIQENENNSLPKLNFDYDKNINEILNNINNIDQNKEENIQNNNNNNNGYSNLFSFNQDISNINNKSDIKENINNNSIQIEENIIENNNINNSIPLRVADIIMKLNSNDILYDIITQLYSKEILSQLMSPNVDINLINIIEQTIEKITILENEEIQKLRNKDSSSTKNNNINNYNKLNIPKKVIEYRKYNTSSSFYNKPKNNSINALPINNKIFSNKKNKTKIEMNLNNEILQNYPKTGKTILGYEKFKQNKNRDFNFERSLRNDNYKEDNYINKRNYNLNISKADSVKNQSYYSINGNNRSNSNKRMIFNNYTSPFGDYFDSSLQKGGESKLLFYPKKNKTTIFKNARSPVKDYINGFNDVYI
jgi:hypothetical protein